MPYACTHSFLPKMRVFAFTVWLLLLGQPRSLFATENEIIPIEDFQKYLDEHFSVPQEPYHIRAILSPSSRKLTSYTYPQIDQGDYRIMPLTSVYRKVKKKIENQIQYLESVDVSCPSNLGDDHPSNVQTIFVKWRCPNGLCLPGQPYRAWAITCKAGWMQSTSALSMESWMICTNGIWSENIVGTVCIPIDVSCPSNLGDDHPSNVEMIFDRRCYNGLCRPGQPYRAWAITCKDGWMLSTSAIFAKSWMICSNGIWSENIVGTVCSPIDHPLNIRPKRCIRAQKKMNEIESETDRDIISN
eukprot:116701_1